MTANTILNGIVKGFSFVQKYGPMIVKGINVACSGYKTIKDTKQSNSAMQDISYGVTQSLLDYCSSKSDKIDSKVMQQSTNTTNIINTDANQEVTNQESDTLFNSIFNNSDDPFYNPDDQFLNFDQPVQQSAEELFFLNEIPTSTNTPQNDIPTENFIELDDISTDTKTTQRTIKNTKNTSINKNAQNISNVINSSVNLISQGTFAKLESNDVINLADNIGTIKEMYTDIKTSGQKLKTKIQNHLHRK